MSAKLLGEARPLLASHKRIIVIPDGPVSLIPPSLLYAEDGAAEPIGVASTVTVAPALRLLVQPVRGNSKAAGLHALGDPSYPPKLKLASVDTTVMRAMGPTRGLLRAAEDGSLTIPPLPETRSEVEAIARSFAGAVTRLQLGADATESGIKTADFSQIGYLHLATHGVLGGEIAGLDEPALLLAEEAGQDTLLRASEAEQLNLQRVELTVLSACNTGSGRLLSGEGVMGLSRAFLLAGSRAVLVSMWPVSSKETEELMVSFYQAHRSGMPVEEALRVAMSKMKMKNPHPMFWAPFIIIRA